MVLMGGCAQLQAMVHGVTTEECQTALQSHGWSVQRAAQYLKVPTFPACPGARSGALQASSAVPDPTLWLCVLCPALFWYPWLQCVLCNIAHCPSGGAALWAGSSATGGVPQSTGDV